MIIDNEDLVTKFECLKYMPGCIAIKDLNSRYCNMSIELLKLTCWSDVNQYIYKTDYDIPYVSEEAADLFVSADKKVIEFKQSITSLVIFNCSLGFTVLLDYKAPLINTQGTIVGVLLQNVNITNYFLNKDQLLYQSDKKFLGQIKVPKLYILTPEASPLPLSSRQQECLALLVRGKAMKEIAFILGISPRTVETHFETIKHKLGCYNKSQLIEKAIDSGFLFHIPINFLGINLIPHSQPSVDTIIGKKPKL